MEREQLRQRTDAILAELSGLHAELALLCDELQTATALGDVRRIAQIVDETAVVTNQIRTVRQELAQLRSNIPRKAS